MNKENILAFINYQYKPLTNDYSTQTLGIVWTTSIISSLACPNIVICLCAYLILDVILTIYTKKFLIKDRRPRSKFLFDGFCWTYISFILLIGSYFLLSTYVGENIWIFFILLAIEILNIIISFVIVNKIIKIGGYNKASKTNTSVYISLINAVLAAVVARALMTQLPSIPPYFVISVCMLIIAVLLSSLSVNFLKVYYYNKLLG